MFVSLFTIPTASAPAMAAPEGIPGIGVQFHAMWSDYTEAERLEVIDKMAKAGLKWLRIDFGWSSIQPTSGSSYAQWYFDRADRVIDAARARGMKVMLTFWRTPNWANGGKGNYAPPSNPADFGRAARYTASYFRGRVDAYEVWNEPNLNGGGFWSGTIADYADLLKASYDDFHAGDPNAKVVAGSVVYNDDVWLRKMYEAGAQGHFDVISTHPYQGIADEVPEAPDNGTKWRLSHVPAVHRLMKEYGDGAKPIWFTEFGWSNHVNTDGLGNWEQGVTAQQQADYFVRAIKYVDANFPYVKNMFWYNERNQDAGKIQLDNYGLLYRNLSPKPVYEKIKSYLSAPVVEPEPTPTPSPTPTTEPTPQPTDEPSPEPTPTEEPTDSEPTVRKNLLRNGGFENGKTGWRASGARLSVVEESFDGTAAGRLAPSRRKATLTSSTPSAEARVNLTGYVKSRRKGQLVKVQVRETAQSGRLIGRRTMWFRTKTTGWQPSPVLSLRASGKEGSRLSVKVRPAGRRPGRILVDSVKLVPGS